MIFLIAGASHTGKTLLAQKLLEKYKYPYLSLDLLKMGLIRSGNTALTPEDDEALESVFMANCAGDDTGQLWKPAKSDCGGQLYSISVEGGFCRCCRE